MKAETLLFLKPVLAKSDKNDSVLPKTPPSGVFWYDKFMIWKLPPDIKIYETLTVMGDGRIAVRGNTAKVVSSNGDKTYTVEYDPEKRSIVSDNNEDFWQKRMGYPSIAYVLQTKMVPYNPKAGELMAGINWKKLNASNKRNYQLSIETVLSKLSPDDRKLVEQEVITICNHLKDLKLNMPEHLKRPVREP